MRIRPHLAWFVVSTCACAVLSLPSGFDRAWPADLPRVGTHRTHPRRRTTVAAHSNAQRSEIRLQQATAERAERSVHWPCACHHDSTRWCARGSEQSPCCAPGTGALLCVPCVVAVAVFSAVSYAAVCVVLSCELEQIGSVVADSQSHGPALGHSRQSTSGTEDTKHRDTRAHNGTGNDGRRAMQTGGAHDHAYHGFGTPRPLQQYTADGRSRVRGTVDNLRIGEVCEWR